MPEEDQAAPPVPAPPCPFAKSQYREYKTVRVGGMVIPYKSHYTQGCYQFLHFSESAGSITYPASLDHGLGLSREDLPQLDYDQLMKDCSARGIVVEHVSWRPSDLTPTQGEFKEDKVHSIMQTPEASNKPIVTTRDRFVLDGHHRWLAAYNLGNQPIPCSQMNLNVDQALDFVSGKDYASAESISEQLINLMTEEAGLRLAVGILSKSLLEGTQEDLAITEAADIAGIDESALVGFLEACVTHLDHAYWLTEEAHPMKVMRRMIRTNKAESVTHKDGKSTEVSPDTARAILHVHGYMNKGSKNRIEKMVHKDGKNFKKISTWANAHATILTEATKLEEKKKKLKKSAPKEVIQDDQMNIDGAGGHSPYILNPRMGNNVGGLLS